MVWKDLGGRRVMWENLGVRRPLRGGFGSSEVGGGESGWWEVDGVGVG